MGSFEKPDQESPDWEHIGKIEPTRDPWLEAQQKKLKDAIAASGELQAITQTIRNPMLKVEDLSGIIRNWNGKHAEWAGYYVEEEFPAANGRTLRVRMDRLGNIQLA